MPTLYVENVPGDLYGALRARARANRSSIAAEVLAILKQNVPTEKELKARREFMRKIQQFQSQKPLTDGKFPSSEEMLREDRER